MIGCIAWLGWAFLGWLSLFLFFAFFLDAYFGLTLFGILSGDIVGFGVFRPVFHLFNGKWFER